MLVAMSRWMQAVGMTMLLSSCFNPSIPEGVSCMVSGVCPDGQTCIEGICRSGQEPVATGCEGDQSGNPECTGVSFQGFVDLPVGPLPNKIVSGDVTGDGHLDLLVSHSIDAAPRGVMLFAGDGAGGFDSPNTFSDGNAAFGLIILDSNQDGLQDLAWLSQEDNVPGGAQSIAIVQQVAPGQFGPLTTLALPVHSDGLEQWQHLHHADVNRDGRKDLVFQESAFEFGTEGVYGYLPQHPDIDGQYEAAQEFQTVLSDGKSHLADLSGDGLIDVLSIGQSGLRYARQSSNVPGTFDPDLLLLDRSGTQMIVDDTNGDGPVDIIALAGDGLFILLQDISNAGSFLTPVDRFVGSDQQRMAGTDLDGDAFMDFVFSTGASLIAERSGPGAFIEGPTLEAQPGFDQDIVAGDFNGDDKPDLAVLHGGDPRFATNGFVRLFLQE